MDEHLFCKCNMAIINARGQAARRKPVSEALVELWARRTARKATGNATVKPLENRALIRRELYLLLVLTVARILALGGRCLCKTLRHCLQKT